MLPYTPRRFSGRRDSEPAVYNIENFSAAGRGRANERRLLFLVRVNELITAILINRMNVQPFYFCFSVRGRERTFFGGFHVWFFFLAFTLSRECDSKYIHPRRDNNIAVAVEYKY